MRIWPFVLRSTYDALGKSTVESLALAGKEIHDKDELITTIRTEKDRDFRTFLDSQRAADVRYESLLARYTQLVVMGAVPRAEPYVAPPAAKVDELEDLIAQVCGLDQRKLGMMMRQLWADRDDKRPDDEIRAEILNGRIVSYEEGLPI